MTKNAGLRAGLRFNVGQLRVEVQLEADSENLVLIGPNGSGKSSLLLSLLGALPLEHGYVSVAGELLVDTENNLNVPLEQRRLAYVPQDYALLPHLSVRKNILFALGSAVEPLAPAQQSKRTDELLTGLGISHLSERHVQTLSGGERQKVALARALSVKPRALLLDEPLAALAVDSRNEVRDFLVQYLKTLAIPAIIVTHDAADARALGQRILVLESGRITQAGSWSELASDPQTEFVKQFVSSP